MLLLKLPSSLPIPLLHIHTSRTDYSVGQSVKAVEFPGLMPLEHFAGYITQIWKTVPLENKP